MKDYREEAAYKAVLEAARVIPSNRKTLLLTECAKKGYFPVYRKFEPIRADEFDFSGKIIKKGRTFSTYLHGLRTVSYLCSSYELTDDIEYLGPAIEIVKKWIDYSEVLDLGYANADEKSDRCWRDHATSNRTKALCHMALLLEQKEIYPDFSSKLLKPAIHEHAKWLYESCNYVEYNHGMMMDEALLVASHTLNLVFSFEKSKLEGKAVRRILAGVERDVSREGVHIENSPKYHSWFLSYLKRNYELIVLADKEKAGTVRKTVELMEAVKKNFVCPDDTLLELGDTSPCSSKYFKPKKPYNLLFCRETGTVIYDSGVVYLAFKNGAKSEIHKHEDDLGVVLYINRVPIIKDPGSLGYEKEFISESLRKRFNHSVPIVEGFDYPEYGASNYHIFTPVVNGEEIYLCGRIDSISGESLVRKIYAGPKFAVVVDCFEGERNSGHVESVFNFPCGSDVELGEGGGFFYSKTSRDKVFFYNDLANIKVYEGDRYQGRGYSVDFDGQAKPAPQISLMSQRPINVSIFSLKEIGEIEFQIAKILVGYEFS